MDSCVIVFWPRIAQDWRGIGRSLSVFVSGPKALASELARESNVLITHQEGPPGALEDPGLDPEFFDVAIVGVKSGQEKEALAIACALRARLLGVVLLIPPNAIGDYILRYNLGAYRHPGGVVHKQIWDMIAVAAQTTWALSWARISRKPKETAPLENHSRQLVEAAMLEPHDVPRSASRTTPWSPPPELPVELTKAYRESYPKR